MTEIDRLLEQVRRDVEQNGKSGAETVFLTNVQLHFPKEVLETTPTCDMDGAICDVSWFFKCAKEGKKVPCGNPDTSFWHKFFGPKAAPYGDTWDLKALKAHFMDPDTRRGVLINYADSMNPACVLCYQFHCSDYGVLDCFATMRSSDVANVLGQDLFMTKLILDEVSKMVGLIPGSITLNIGNAHVYYNDLEFTEEFTLEYGY